MSLWKGTPAPQDVVTNSRYRTHGFGVPLPSRTVLTRIPIDYLDLFFMLL